MKKSYVYAALAIVLWSTMPTISKLLLGEMDSYVLLLVSSLFASAALLLVNLLSKKLRVMRGYSVKDYLRMAVIGLPGVFLYYAFYYAGTERMPASQAFIVNYLWPIMSIVFSCILLKEKMTPRKGIAVAMSFAGVFTVAGGDVLRFELNTALGVLFCFCAAVCYGLFTALNKKSSYDEQVSMMVAMAVAALPSLAIVIMRGGSLAISPSQIPGILWNGVFTMALANLSWALALASGSTAKVSNLAYITPFLSLLWTFFVLKEKIEPLSVIGLCMIVLGIFIQLKDPGSGKENEK